MAAPLDLDQLRTFVAVVDMGSFTRAAEDVFKTQSAVSMQVRKLEERLGAELFERGGRAVRLTDEGARLLTYARRMLALSQETLTAFDEAHIAGHVRIGLPDDYAERFLPEIMARFARSNPRVEMQIACETTSSLIEHLEKGHLDVALVCPSRAHAWSEIVRREPLHFVTSGAHAAHEETIVPLAIGRSDCDWRRQGLEALDRMKRPYRVLFTSWSAQIVTSAVLAGLAVSVLPECALRPGMRVLTEEDGFPRLGDATIAVMRGRNSETPAVCALISHIRESLRNLVPPQIEEASDVPETRCVRPARTRGPLALAT